MDAAGSAFVFDYSSGGNGTLMSGGAPGNDGAVVLFTNVATIDGVAIDAVVTTDLNGATVSNYDNIGSASANKPYFQVNNSSTAAGGYTAFTFDFYEHGSYTGVGTGSPVTLRNVAVTSIDIDSPGIQFQDFVGYQSYVLNSPTGLLAVDKGAGVTRFEHSSAGSNNSNIPQDAVQVTFDAVSSFTAKFGNEQSGQQGYFGVTFEQLADVFAGDPNYGASAPVTNPSNRPPTSNDTTRYVVTGQPSIVQLADFGTFADPDSNPFVSVQITAVPSPGSLQKYVGGTWQAVSASDVITTADIQNGNLRFTGSADDSLQFTVNDGLVNSTSTYTMTLLVAPTAQTITFNNPGTKLPTDPAFASGATASSGLTVTLTSLTPGVCTVSGLNIDPVAEGTCTVVATQAGNSSYGAADPVTQTFPVSTKSAQTITAPSPGTQSAASFPTTITVAPTASSNLTVSVLSLTTDVCTVSGFTVTLLGPGNCTLRNTQPGNGTYAPAPVVQYTFQVQTAVAPTLTYDANGANSGTVPADQTGPGSVTVSGNTGSLMRSGYTFGGWTIGGSAYVGGSSYNLAADATAYAIWNAVAPSYTLSYDSNGADSGTVPSNQTGSGSVTVAGNTGSLVKSGYTFGGWTIGGGTYAGGSSYTLSATVTAHAIWNAVYTLNFVGNGAVTGTAPADQTGTGTITLPSTPGSLVKPGFKFAGWTINGVTYAPGTPYTITGNFVVYAAWDEELASTGADPRTGAALALTLLLAGLVALGASQRRRNPEQFI